MLWAGCNPVVTVTGLRLDMNSTREVFFMWVVSWYRMNIALGSQTCLVHESVIDQLLMFALPLLALKKDLFI